MIGSIILTAIPIGLAISLSPGAALFGIIQTSLSKGFTSGISFAMGISLGDMLFIALCIWGLSGLMDHQPALKIFGFVCGAVLIVYGLITFFHKKDTVTDKQRQQVADLRMKVVEGHMQVMDEHQQQVGEYVQGVREKLNVPPPRVKREHSLRNNIFRPMAKGFLFNFINPCAWVLWLGILPITATYELWQQILFFACILLSILFIDLMKSYFAGRIKNMINPKMMFLINRIIGIIFCILGVAMIIKMGVLAH
ncbi:MAG: LysE family translocator [Bacteroidales bacterium]|nr:LysE family translocator [Bacteroidales bacterium]